LRIATDALRVSGTPAEIEAVDSFRLTSKEN
jgi:hypothetical protein